MKINLLFIAIIVAIILYIASCVKRNEMFDNSGALMQLTADHVPDISTGGVSFL
jgi:ABC-type dipeptide/oligopeptide/nickel transport system permease component